MACRGGTATVFDPLVVDLRLWLRTRRDDVWARIDEPLTALLRNLVEKARRQHSPWHDISLDSDPEDLLQECYCRLLASDARSLRSFRGENGAALVAYLQRVTSSVLVSHWRARRAAKRRVPAPVSVERLRAVGREFPTRSFGDDPARRFRLEDLRRQVRRVSAERSTAATTERNQKIACWALIDGLSVADIVYLLDGAVSRAAVECVITRVRRRLRADLPRAPQAFCEVDFTHRPFNETSLGENDSSN